MNQCLLNLPVSQYLLYSDSPNHHSFLKLIFKHLHINHRNLHNVLVDWCSNYSFFLQFLVVTMDCIISRENFKRHGFKSFNFNLVWQKWIFIKLNLRANLINYLNDVINKTKDCLEKKMISTLPSNCSKFIQNLKNFTN